jgi:PqqD family protein of HPr-rel-A system
VAVYRAADARSLRIEPLDPMTAILHRPSGQTHLVSSPVPEIIEVLGTDTLNAGALLARLAARFDLRDGERAALEARLEEMAAIGLVERL